ncbi:MAG: hypothetical protein R3293_02595 [Candidatus Promineifilaceae bacterium]|nr:hypothetical protein [Candidatus Promineifilaceae bacterium]
MIPLEIIVFGFTLWLGAYLISRNPSEVRLLLAGTGLISYAVALAFGILAGYGANRDLISSLLRWQIPVLLLPVFCWLLLLIHLLRGDESWYSRLQNHPNPLAVVITASVFFGLGVGLLILPFDWIPHNLLILAIGADLLLLGAAVAFLDAFDEGETLLPHMIRSFSYALLVSLVFGGQFVLAIAISTGLTSPMLILLLGVISAAILLQTFSSSVQHLLDTLALYRSPQIAQSQATLRETAGSAARQGEAINLAQLNEQDFTRLTRRALSHMGNIPRLSTSPLTHLPVVNEGLEEQDTALDTLQRATKLRTVLAESIDRLKPEKDGQFGTTDQWRHFNALYYPYVVGIKPYSRRNHNISLNENTSVALKWFRSQVPPRTLYNWQNSAAKLVAQDLRERSWPAAK